MRPIYLLFLFPLISSAYLDNHIIGMPKVICEENDVSLDVLTAKPFNGQIFVKGSRLNKIY
ncbi:ZP domain-containing protein [Aphelenchoides bicaudatus]|nr:ZP domain-containing protein [Aphelenchoides bicaudatus]